MAFRSPVRTSSASRSALPQQPAIAAGSSRPSSRGIRRPFGAPSPGNPLPGTATPPRPKSKRSCRASSRASTPASVRLRRFPRPWRLAPPRTLRRISTTHAHGVRSPGSPWNRPDASAKRPIRPDAGGEVPRRRLPVEVRCRTAEATLCRLPLLQPPKRPVQLRLPSAYAHHLIDHPSACADFRRVTSPNQVAPVRPSRRQAATTRGARPRYRGCSSRSSPTASPVLTKRTAGLAGNGPSRARLRSQPSRLSTTRMLASAGFSAAALPPLPEGNDGWLAVAAGSEDSLYL
jgi:hypothetical protein